MASADWYAVSDFAGRFRFMGKVVLSNGVEIPDWDRDCIWI